MTEKHTDGWKLQRLRHYFLSFASSAQSTRSAEKSAWEEWREKTSMKNAPSVFLALFLKLHMRRFCFGQASLISAYEVSGL